MCNVYDYNNILGMDTWTQTVPHPLDQDTAPPVS